MSIAGHGARICAFLSVISAFPGCIASGDPDDPAFEDEDIEAAELSLSSMYEAEPNNAPGDVNTKWVTMGDDNYGSFSGGGDVDYWKFRLEGRTKVNFFLDGIPSESDYDMKVFRSTDLQNPVWSGTAGGNAYEIGVGIPLNQGTYYIKVYPYQGARSDVSYHMRYAATAVSRGWEWVNARVPYCGGANGATDVLCGGTCYRTGAAANPAWDPYRSDCSGFVSWAWGLPAPGRTTWSLPGVASAIMGSSLAPGDALIGAGHAVLFASWINKSMGRALVLHEPSCGHVASAVEVTLATSSSSSSVALWGQSYTAYRQNVP